MKKIIAIAIYLISINKIYANNDSLVINNDTLKEVCTLVADIEKDTAEIEIHNQSEIISKPLDSKLFAKQRKTESTLLNNNPVGLGDFLNDIWDFISSQLAQAKIPQR